ncbi:MAG TPA: efflux transporter outer membrane subunit [Planctomycetota bacterium]|nr:efflux transporter outer membrane subunit [Planctomycetota bacterium]
MNAERSKLRAARRVSRVALSAAAITAAGCMVGPDYEAPQTTLSAAYGESVSAPAQQTTFAVSGPAEVRWWRELGDPLLTELVEQSLTANYSIAVAEARLREARAARRVAQSLLYPQVGVGASALRFRGSEAAIDLQGLDLEDSLFQIGFDASWAVDVFGGARRGVESAQAIEQAVAADRRAVVLIIAAETARAYLELRGVQRQLQIDLDILEQQQHTLTITEDRRRAGLASDLEVLRARIEVEATAAEIPQLQQASRQYIHLISTLLGLEPMALSSVLERPAPVPAVPEQIVIGIPSDLLRRRPDIQAAERQLAAATAQVGVATAELFPQVVLGASAGLQSRDTDDLFNGNSSDDSSSYYLAGPVINWTLFDAGRREAGITFAEARVDAAKAAYEEVVLGAFREVESSLVAVDRARERVGDLQRLSTSARQSAEIARSDYERGLLDQLTVLDAQRQSNRADLLHSQGEVSLVVYVVTLYKALGGGWEVAEPPPDPESVAVPGNEGAVHERQ